MSEKDYARIAAILHCVAYSIPHSEFLAISILATQLEGEKLEDVQAVAQHENLTFPNLILESTFKKAHE